jgi:uncharacterized surface protein with fasciclin (FAS1) repeats
MKIFSAFAAILALGLAAPALAGSGYHSDKSASYHGENDIVDVAVDAGSFTTLVAAVQAAGLVETLKGDGPFTVFAPTDEAFAKIPKEQLDALLADKQKLTEVLTYHVVPGRVMAAEVVELDSAKTVQGQSLAIAACHDVERCAEVAGAAS